MNPFTNISICFFCVLSSFARTAAVFFKNIEFPINRAVDHQRLLRPSYLFLNDIHSSRSGQARKNKYKQKEKVDRPSKYVYIYSY